MKSFVITITADCPDNVPEALLHNVAAKAAIPLLDPERWLNKYELLCTNVTTHLKVSTIDQETGERLDPAVEEARRIILMPEFKDKKIQAIKELRSIAQMGLKEAKDLIDANWYLQSVARGPYPTEVR